MKLPWRKPAPASNRGQAGEQLAREYLNSQGLALVTTNYRCRRGEIDIIVRDGDTLVFVEVRLRSNPRFAGAADSVDARKQRRLIAAAEHYLLHQHGDNPPPCRFDVIALTPATEQPAGYRIEWLQDAFRPDY